VEHVNHSSCLNTEFEKIRASQIWHWRVLDLLFAFWAICNFSNNSKTGNWI